MKSIGFSSFAISIETVIFLAIAMIASVPFGVLADKWSRRGVLLLSCLFFAVGSLICGLSNGVVLYIIGMSFWGLYSAAYSGCYQAIVYDVLQEEQGSSEGFERNYGRIQLYKTLALVTGSLLSGIIASHVSLRATYLYTLPFILIAAFCLLKFKEPTLHKQMVSKSKAAGFKNSMKAITSSSYLLWLSLLLMLTNIGFLILAEFGQLWLVALSLPIILYGPVTSISQLGIGFSGYVADKIKNSQNLIIIFSIMLLVSSYFLTTHLLSLIIFADFVITLGMLSISIIISRRLHDHLPASLRTSGTSIIETASYPMFFVLALIFGYISTKSSIFNAAWIMVALCFALVTVLFFGMRQFINTKE